MNIKQKLFFCLTLAAIAFCISPMHASAQAVVNQQNIRIPWSGCQMVGGFYFCSEYEAHIVARTILTPSGRYSGEYHFEVDHFRGVLADGTPVHISQSVNEKINADFDGAGGEYTYTNHLTAATKGSTDNFIISVTVHMTVNTNGELTATVENVTIEYRG
jgi:hypothetical protein